MKLNVRWFVPVLMLAGSFAFADEEIHYDDGTAKWASSYRS
jgi:hypothetical protein